MSREYRHLFLKMLLMTCLLLQLVAPAFACQHDGLSQPHQACHSQHDASQADDDREFCAKCFAGVHGWSPVTTLISPAFPIAGKSWTISAYPDLTAAPGGRLFKPPISV